MARPLTDPLDRTIWTPRLDARLRKYRAAGLTYKAIASNLGVSWRSVCGRARLLGLPAPRNKRWSAEEDAELLIQRRNGWTAKRSAASLKRSLSSVKYRLTVLLRIKP